MAENDAERSQEQSKPQAPARSSAPAGDHIAVNVGEGAQNVAAGKNILQIGSLSIPRWAALLIVGTLAAVAVLAGVVAYFNQQTSENTGRTAAILAYTPTPSPTATPVPSPTPTALPFAPAADGETLIVILPFHSTAATDSEPHKKIWREIETLIAEVPDSGVRAAIDPNITLTADQQAEAERVGKLHNAGMIIWGEDTGVELIASFLNLREPDFDAADVDIAETERTQLANPSQYAQFVTRDLPGQMAFLSLFAVGQSHYLNHNYARAIDTIEAAVAAAQPPGEQSGGQTTAIVEGLADAYFRLGWLHQEPPYDLEAAIADYSRTIDLNPQSAPAYNNRGLAYTDQEDFDRALADYNQAIELDPQYVLAYYGRGTAYYFQGDFPRAIADYDQVIALDPQYALAYNNRGGAYREQGDLPRALADFSQAIALDPQYAFAYINLGNAYVDQGDFPQAIAEYSRAIDINPQDANAYFNRGSACYEQGDLAQAIADYSRAIDINPQDAGAYFNRGLAYDDQGDIQLAVADYRKAVELDPQNADANNSLCWSLALRRQAEAAMPYCEQAVSLADDPTYRDSRGLARALLDDYAAAAADFQTYLDWLVDNSPEETAMIERRRAWIEALERGENPFTPAVLAELRSE